MAVWEPEFPLELGQASRLIADQFPHLGDDVEHLSDGWDFSVFTVRAPSGPDHVFRFPRRSLALGCLRTELEVLPRLSRAGLGHAIPSPAFLGSPGDGFPHPFWGGELIPGVELAAAELADGDRVALGASVGTFLGRLHALPPAGAGPNLAQDPNRRGDPAHRAGMLPDHLSRHPSIAPRIAEWVAVGEGSDRVLCHGDLHARHLIVDEGRLMGVIDWGDACIADPAIDLSIAFAGFVGQSRRALLLEYGGISDEAEARARLLAVQLCGALHEYAVAQGNAALAAEASAGILRALA